MNHKEEMEYLKENDPITYYELTGNPTGTDLETYGGCIFFFIVVFIVFIIGIIITYLK